MSCADTESSEHGASKSRGGRSPHPVRRIWRVRSARKGRTPLEESIDGAEQRNQCTDRPFG